MIRYAIVGSNYRSNDAERWVAGGVDFVQLRAKAMEAGELAALAREIMRGLDGKAKLLINGRADVAIAVGAAGVHLTARPDELTPAQGRKIFGARAPVVSVSCHTLAEVERAGDADFILFGPVFEKSVEDEVVVEGVGLEMLRQACEIAPGKVLALGGVSLANAQACIEAGAVGVAGIRLFSLPQ